MINQLKYFCAALITIPFLPFIYFQGKKVKADVPILPEAEGHEGVFGNFKKQINLLALGESTIAGVGVDQHKNGLTGALAKHFSELQKYQVNWKVVAKSGFTAYQTATKLVPKIGTFDPDIIVIGLGANDAFQLNSPKRWRSSMKSLLTRLNNTFPKSIIVCINMPPIKEFPVFTPLMKKVMGNLVELFGKELKHLVKNYSNVFYIDQKLTLEDWIKKQNNKFSVQDFFSDGVHPSQLTYQIWGKEVAEFIFANHLLELLKKD